MSSKSNETVKDETQNVAIDRRAVQEQGQQVLDSIIIDPSDEVMRDMLTSLEAQWRTMVEGNALNLVEVLGFGDRLVELADTSQITIDGVADSVLKNGLAQIEAMARNGDLVVRLADGLAGQALDVAQDATEAALDVVAEVKTADFADNLKTISTTVMLFALAAMYMTTKRG